MARRRPTRPSPSAMRSTTTRVTLVQLRCAHAGDATVEEYTAAGDGRPRQRSTPWSPWQVRSRARSSTKLQTAQVNLEAAVAQLPPRRDPGDGRSRPSRSAAQGADRRRSRPRATRCATPGRPRAPRRNDGSPDACPVSPDRPATPVAYAGEPGAFAEDAVIAAFGDVARVSLGGFREVFEIVTSGAADAGVVPIENVINGTVRENYDLLLEHDLEIRGEVVVPVAALPGGAPGAAPRRHRTGLLAHPGPRSGRGVPASTPVAAAVDLQHGRCREGDRRSRRAWRGGRPVAASRGPVRARDPRRRDRRPAGEPDALRRARPAR